MLAVLSVGVLSAAAFWGIGSLLLPRRDPDQSWLERTALCLSIGLLWNLVLVLSCPTLSLALLGTIVPGLAGLVRARLLSRTAPAAIRPEPRWALALAGVVLCCFAIKVLSQPLTTWDARSIWFFQGRIIAQDNGLHLDAGWGNPALAWSHPDYPKLLPSLAAEVAALTGYWNEYAPKASLLLLLLPPLALLFSRCEASGAWLLLSVSWLFGLGDVLWNGLADGFLALYVAGGALKLSDYARDGRPTSLATAIAFLGVACALKNEGLLFTLATVMVFWWSGFGSFSTARRASVVVATALALAPTIIWGLVKSSWHLQNDLELGSMESLERIRARRMDGHSLRLIFRELALAGYGAWKPACVVAVLVAVKLLHRRGSAARLLPGMAGVVAFAGLCLVYLSTPYDLRWHLGSSAGRAMLTIVLLFETGAACLLGEWDARDAVAKNASAEAQPD